MNLIDIVRTTTFRLASAFAGFFVGAILLLFTFIYLNTAIYERQRVRYIIEHDVDMIAAEPHAIILDLVSRRVTNYAGLFDAQGHRISGNLRQMPSNIAMDGQVHLVTMNKEDGITDKSVMAAARQLQDGSYLIIGRNSTPLVELRHVVLRALELGVIPAIALSLAAGIFLSLRAQQRVREVHHAAERIMSGNLRERLPLKSGSHPHDEFDRLSVSVNRMLDEIERLMAGLKATGDEIAHDLRTPLTRVRARLERALKTTQTDAELRATVESAISALDQTLAIITALLRIREIEAGQRRSGFGQVDLNEILLDIDDLYQPIAEERGTLLQTSTQTLSPVRGDRDLLMEAIGNLVDNAIKFTADSGKVSLRLLDEGAEQTVEIADNGSGIAFDERAMVFTRFYRSEKTRDIRGTGLGLSLVAAISKLHDGHVMIADNHPGSLIRFTIPAIAGAVPHAVKNQDVS